MGSTKTTVRESLVQAVSLIIFLASLAVLTACGEVESAEVTQKHVEEATARKEIRPEPFFAHPLTWEVRVSTRGAGEQWEHRFYTRSSVK